MRLQPITPRLAALLAETERVREGLEAMTAPARARYCELACDLVDGTIGRVVDVTPAPGVFVPSAVAALRDVAAALPPAQRVDAVAFLASKWLLALDYVPSVTPGPSRHPYSVFPAGPDGAYAAVCLFPGCDFTGEVHDDFAGAESDAAAHIAQVEP